MLVFAEFSWLAFQPLGVLKNMINLINILFTNKKSQK